MAIELISPTNALIGFGGAFFALGTSRELFIDKPLIQKHS